MDCKPERLVCAVFVALTSQPVSNEQNCLFLVVAFTYFFIPAKLLHCSTAEVLWDALFHFLASHVPICIQILIYVCDWEQRSL